MPRPSNASKQLATVTLSDLQSELARRQEMIPTLLQQREAIVEQIAAIDAQIGGAPSGARRGRAPKAGAPRNGRRRARGPRAKNAVSLVDALAAVLKDKVMGVSEAGDAVRAAGYKSSAANFRVMVNGALLKGPFKKVARGQYTAK